MLGFHTSAASRKPQPSKGPCIVIGEDTISQLPAISTNPLCIHLSPVEVDALLSSGGEVRKGVMSTVALSAPLAIQFPLGAMTRLLMPWALAGNWLSKEWSTLTTLSTPFYGISCLRRSHSCGTSSEVPEINPNSMPGVDLAALRTIRSMGSTGLGRSCSIDFTSFETFT